MRQALRDLDTQRDSYLRAKAKTAQLETRLGHDAGAAAGLPRAGGEGGGRRDPRDQRAAAGAVGQEVHRARASTCGCARSTLEQLAKFLKAHRDRPQPGGGHRADVRTRDDKHEELDVEMTVSTYEHATDVKATKKKESKG